jgi:hypothetical protein
LIPWRVAWPWVVATAIVAWFGYKALSAAWHFTIDDSGISFAYAKHIAEGNGPVAAIGGPRVEGYSNALWVFLLVPFCWFDLPIQLVSKLLGVACLVITLVAGACLLLRTQPKRPLGVLLAAFWGVASVLTLEIAVWTVAGLENALLSALLFSMVYCDAVEHERHDRFPVSAILGFLLCITRPEGPAYAMPLLALKAAFAWRDPRLRAQLRRAVIWFVAPLAVYHAVHFAVFREFVPNTYFAKPRSDSFADGIQYLRSGMRESRLLYVLPVALLGLWGHWRLKILVLWVALFGCLFVLYSGGDWMPHGRFISFFAPALLLLLSFGAYNCALWIAWLIRRLSASRISALIGVDLARSAHVMAVGFLLLSTVALGFKWQEIQLARLRRVKQDNFCHFCERLKDSQKLHTLSKKARLGAVSVLTHDFGGPSWLSNENYYPIDFLGLCDATISRLRNARNALNINYPLFAHLLHEQSNGPSWIYLPRNFWPRLKDIAESHLAYIPLKASQLPHDPNGSFLNLHRRELVDFFPPFATTTLQSPSVAIRLLGSTVTTTPEATQPGKATKGAKVRVSVVVLAESSALKGKLGISFGKGAPTSMLALDRALRGIQGQLVPGEPLRFDFDLTLPEPRGNQYTFRLGYGQAPTQSKKRNLEWTYVELPSLSVGASISPAERKLNRYPNALPPPLDSILVELQPEVATLLELPIGTALDARQALARRLIERGQALEGSADAQSYLAYVWATQVHPPSWLELTKPLLRVRPSLNIADFSLQILLLRDHYANPSDASRTRLVQFYRSRQLHAQENYFAQQLDSASSPPESHPAKVDELNPAKFANNWTGNLPMRAVQGDSLPIRTLLPDLVLSSENSVPTRGSTKPRKGNQRHSAQGEVLSLPFELTGSRLSLMVGGGKSSDRVGVELLVEDQVVYSGAGISEGDLFPVLWDISKHQGKLARVRIFDRNTNKSVYVGGVELWQ